MSDFVSFGGHAKLPSGDDVDVDEVVDDDDDGVDDADDAYDDGVDDDADDGCCW